MVHSIKVLTVFLVVLALSQAVFSLSHPYFDEDEGDQQAVQQLGSDVTYMDSMSASDNDLMDLSSSPQKRSCIRRGGSCDHRRNDCCFSSSCRCNLWGSNCRCHRAGLFQKWG